ncbi:unnamed protein product [Brugia timori]|uniref:Uncharacterized protein n=1 Tax=Brugia timori TaxID=42155 RepID=A0A0R3QZ89_9BILA|nr:unnamed protein product [Brugia timori]
MSVVADSSLHITVSNRTSEISNSRLLDNDWKVYRTCLKITG